MSKTLLIKIAKEHIGFHYLLTGFWLYFLIFFRIEYLPLEVLNKIRDKSITHNIFRIQDNEFIMCGFYCIAFIEYMLAGKTLLDYTNLFSPNDYKKNDIIIYKYFKDKLTGEASLKFRLRKIDETRNYNHNDLMSENMRRRVRI